MVCGKSLLVSQEIESVRAILVERIQRLVAQVDGRTQRRLHWAYFLLSAATLWISLALTVCHVKSWALPILLSVVYIAVFLALARFLISRKFILAILTSARLLVLSFVLNGLTAMLALQYLIGYWWAGALILAFEFVSAWAGAYIFSRYVLPMAYELLFIFIGPRSGEYNSASPQGRSAKIE